MKSPLVIPLLLTLLLLNSRPVPVLGQEDLDDELPFGAPDILLYSQDGAQPRENIDLTLSRATGLDQRGIVFNTNFTQFYQGVAHGGRDQQFVYGGHGDYVLNVDFDKLVGQQGLFMQMRAEHRFGQDVNFRTGALMPASILMSLPSLDDGASYTHTSDRCRRCLCSARLGDGRTFHTAAILEAVHDLLEQARWSHSPPSSSGCAQAAFGYADIVPR